MSRQEQLLKADISINASGDNTIIAAPSETGATYIVIDHINLVPAAAVTVQLKDGSTSYGGAYPLTTSQGFVLENAVQDDHGIITLSPNSAFVINLGGAVQVSGFVRYRLLSSA